MSTRVLEILIWSRKQGFVKHPFDAIADLDDLVDNAGFTSIHNIVCGLTIGDLQNELKYHPELIDKQDNDKRTPLFWAVYLHDIDMINILLKHRAEVSLVDAAGYSILHSCGGNIHALQFVLESLSASETNVRQLINQRNKYGSTAWHDAKTGSVLSLYIEHGCDLSLLGAQGRTVLHFAMLYDRAASFAEALMVPNAKAGTKAVDMEARDIDGDTAYDEYEMNYPTRRAKRSREGRAKMALLKYVESLRDRGDGSRIREVEEDEDDGDEDEEGDGEQNCDDNDEDNDNDNDDEGGNGQNDDSMKSIHGSGQGPEQHATGGGETNEEDLSDDELEAFEDALDHLELLGEA